MKYTIVLTASITLVLGQAFRADAQFDSTHLDLGYLTLKKDFTQQVVIRGADLEKMPFTNLSDAIGVWLYGAYSNPGTLQYVVDGNPVADVNAYSIYDIEEVVLVQHAAGLISTAPGQSELVLIRTKRGRGPGGITASAQTGLVSATGDGYTVSPKLFHSYYAGGYKTLGKLSFGVSANYIRDIQPYTVTGETMVTPNHWQRWRLNGYVDWRPDAHNIVELTMNYTPEQLDGEQDSTTGYPTSYWSAITARQHFVLPHLDWRGNWGKGFTNDLQSTYLHSDLTSADVEVYHTTVGDNAGLLKLTTKSYHLWIRDHLAYSAKLGGGWLLEPSLNLSFEHINDNVSEVSAYGVPIIPSLLLNPQNYSSVSLYAFRGVKTDLYLLVPALDLSYKGAFDVQGGAMVHTGTQSLTGNGRQVYPYGGLTVDLLKLMDEHSSSSLKLFGSAVSATAPSNNAYALADFSYGTFYANPYPSYNPITYQSGPPYGPPAGYVYPKPPAYPAWEAGVSYRGWGGRLELAYTFERRLSTTYGVVELSNGFESTNYVYWHSSLHHADFRIGVVDAPEVSWKTGLNVTLLRSVDTRNGAFEEVPVSAGDIAPQPWSWTGGWVNRVQVKDFSAGFDLLYHFGESDSVGSGAKLVNSVVTPNVYVGYRFHVGKIGIVEVFADTRGMIMHNANQEFDPRQYYTVGGKLKI
jgi:hypothetical protein